VVAVVVTVPTIVFIIVVGPAMPVVVIGCVPGDRPILELDDAASDQITEGTELRHVHQRIRE
jgi:hypothetical protein